MSTLHIVNKTGQPFTLCLRSLGEKDGIIFIEDGVYNLQEINGRSIQVNQPLFALLDDCRARGFDISNNPIEGISMDEFVELTEKYSKTISWY